MVAKQSHDTDGIYFLEEPIALAEVEHQGEGLHGSRHETVFESQQLNDVLMGRDSVYDFDECYSDDSSSSSLDDEDEEDNNRFFSGENNTVSLHRLLQMTLQDQSTHSNTSHFGELTDHDDEDSILTFNSFANAGSRGIRKWKSGGSVKSLFSETSLKSRHSITSIGELSTEDEDASELLVEMAQNLRL